MVDFEHPDAFTENQFIEWLTEGRHDCEVAQALLHTWTRFLKGTPSDTLSDFYHDLLHEVEEEEDVEEKPRENSTNDFFRILIAIHQRKLCFAVPCGNKSTD